MSNCWINDRKCNDSICYLLETLLPFHIWTRLCHFVLSPLSPPFVICDPHISSHPQGKFVRSPSFSLFVAPTFLCVYVYVCMCVKMQNKATVNTHHISHFEGNFLCRRIHFIVRYLCVCVRALKCHMITQFIVENGDIYQFKRCTERTVTQCHCDINLFLFLQSLNFESKAISYFTQWNTKIVKPITTEMCWSDWHQLRIEPLKAAQLSLTLTTLLRRKYTVLWTCVCAFIDFILI